MQLFRTGFIRLFPAFGSWLLGATTERPFMVVQALTPCDAQGSCSPLAPKSVRRTAIYSVNLVGLTALLVTAQQSENGCTRREPIFFRLTPTVGSLVSAVKLRCG